MPEMPTIALAFAGRLHIGGVEAHLLALIRADRARRYRWLVLAPINAERASYAPAVFFVVVLAVLLLTILFAHRFYHGRLRRAAAWDCGFPAQDARMQDTAEGFGQPIRQIFDAFMRVEREMPDPFDRHPHYHGASVDRLWLLLYAPIDRIVDWLSKQAGRLQHGHIQWYLFYSFATLLFLLVFIR